MPTGATGQLGLALPVQGELSGTWGDTVNNGITQYANIAIAATLTLTNDGAVTLANTTGDATASNITSSLTGAGTVTAQFAIVRVTGTLTTAKVVTAPSYSKTYTVVNAATGGIVTFKASGQTGVSIAVGESAFVYFNGTDYVKVSSTVDTGVTSFSAGTTGLTPSTATTGAVTLAGTLAIANGGTGTTSTTFANLTTNVTGTLPIANGGTGTTSTTFANLTTNVTGTLPVANGGTALTSFTSGGVVYASSSSALATGSALVFDGTNLGMGVTPNAWTLGRTISFNDVGSAVLGFNGFISLVSGAYFNSGTWKYSSSSSSEKPALYIASDAAHTWYNAVAGTVNNAFSFTQAMTLNSSGNLGIGTSSPTDTFSFSKALDVNGSSGAFVYVRNNGSATNVGGIGYSGTDLYITNKAAGNIRFFCNTDATERARISSTGGFSVGTTSDPGAGAIYATGNITAFFSDKRLKTVSGKIENALDKVAKLSGVYYTNNSVAKSFGYDSDEVQVGVLAQEVEAVLPQIVKAAPFDLDENNNSKSGENYKTVQYDKLVPLLIEAINELRAEVKALKGE